jgi:hypothetical protein
MATLGGKKEQLVDGVLEGINFEFFQRSNRKISEKEDIEGGKNEYPTAF